MFRKGIEFSSSTLIELSEKFHKLQTVGVHVSAHGVDREIQRVADHKHQDEQDDPRYGIAEHAPHLVEHGGNNAGRKAEGQQSGLGKDVAQIGGYAVCAVKSL